MLANFVKETVSAAPLTGDMLLNGKSDAAHIAFGTIYADGEQVRYLATDGDDRELGEGTYNLTADSITRNTIIETIDSGVFDKTNPSAISLTASTIVSIVSSVDTSLPARKQQWDQNYICGGMVSLAGSLGGFAAGNIYATPFNLQEAVTIDQLSLRVVTAQVASNAMIGIYSTDEDGKPADLLATSAELDTSSTGIISSTLSPTVRLEPGFYFGVMWGSDAIDPGAGTPYVAAIGLYDNISSALCLKAAKTYASILPADISGETWAAHTGATPAITMRRKA